MTSEAGLDSNQEQSINWKFLDGVRTRRVAAAIIDYSMVLLLFVISIPVVFLFGFATLGIGWMLFAILGPLVALTYVAWTLGGPKQATWGMQIMNIKLVRYDGRDIDWMTGLVHAVLFWASWVIFAPVLLAPLLLDDKKTLHDLALGTLVVRDI